MIMRAGFGLLQGLILLFSVGVSDAAPRIVAWGAGTFVSHPLDYNNYGQSIVPGSLTNAAYVTGGWRHSLAVRANNALAAWGDDTLGQTDLPPLSTGYLALAAGRLHSLGLHADGSVS